MTGSQFAQYIRKLTSTSATTLPDVDICMLANIEKDDIAERITEEIREDFFRLDWQRDLVAGTREYTLPAELLIALDGIDAYVSDEWQRLREYGREECMSLVTEDAVRSAFAGRKPRYHLLDRGIRLLTEDAITDVENGLRVSGIVYPADLSSGNLSGTTDLSIPSSSTTTAMPRASHKVWALCTSIAYKQSRPKKIALNDEEKNIEAYMNVMFSKLRSRNIAHAIVPSVPRESGFNY